MGIKDVPLFDELKTLIVEGNTEKVLHATQNAVEQGHDPIEIIEKGLAVGLQQIGDAFSKGEAFLYDMVFSAEAMKEALKILDAEIKKRGLVRQETRTMVIGTVAGDIHDIGKTIVSTLFTVSGFKVHDLGIDVPTEKFIEAVRAYKPDIVGLSSLLSISKLKQAEVIQALESEGLREQVKVLVGGGSVDEDFANQIKADGYAKDAQTAIVLGNKLVTK